MRFASDFDRLLHLLLDFLLDDCGLFRRGRLQQTHAGLLVVEPFFVEPGVVAELLHSRALLGIVRE